MNTNFPIFNNSISGTVEYTDEYIIILTLICGLTLLILITLLFTSNLTPHQQLIQFNNTLTHTDNQQRDITKVELGAKNPFGTRRCTENTTCSDVFITTANKDQINALMNAGRVSTLYRDSNSIYCGKKRTGLSTRVPVLLTIGPSGVYLKIPALYPAANSVFTSRDVPVHYNGDGTMNVFLKRYRQVR